MWRKKWAKESPFIVKLGLQGHAKREIESSSVLFRVPVSQVIFLRSGVGRVVERWVGGVPCVQPGDELWPSLCSQPASNPVPSHFG